ncbi:MAG: hypothetical protein KJ568_00290 [Actinobacteria bacterium]|nr:hypothetical protein [Actinomycetota bacterium]
MTNAALFTQCSKEQTGDEQSGEVSAEESDELAGSVDRNLVSDNTGFGFDIFKELILEDKDKNIFISPLSILFALAMTYNGAVGDTNLAMAEALKFMIFTKKNN